MSTYSKIELNKVEQRFVDSFMDDTIHPQSLIYWEMVKKFLQRYQADHANQTSLITESVAAICENILYKINMAEADAAIELILAGAPGTATKPNIKRAVRVRRTSRMSLDQFLMTKADSVDAKTLSCIQANPNITRRELSERLEMRLSTVCGAVNRLYKDDLIRVSGVTVDKDSNKRVETLEVR